MIGNAICRKPFRSNGDSNSKVWSASVCRWSCSARAADEFLRTRECQFGGNLDGRFQRPVDPAEIGNNAMHSVGRLLVLGTRLQAQDYVNAPDDHHSSSVSLHP